MTQVYYTYSNFDAVKAASGSLCGMMRVNIPTYEDTVNDETDSEEEETINNNTEEESVLSDDVEDNDVCTKIISGGNWIDNPYLKLGVCKKRTADTFAFYSNGEEYLFNILGKPLSQNAIIPEDDTHYWVLKMLEIKSPITEVGEIVASTTTQAIYTRSAIGDGYDSTKVSYQNSSESPTNVVVDNLTVRDEFATQALRGILTHVDNPAALSNNEMNYYCQQAYQWASNMMVAAANVRASLNSEGTTVETRANVDALSGNTEKLLSNVVMALDDNTKALEKTDELIETTGYWSKGTDIYENLHYDVDELNHAAGTNYSTIAEAELDGWSFNIENNIYSERISVPALIEWLQAYIAHTPGQGEPSTKTTVRFDDLIKAIKDISGADLSTLNGAITGTPPKLNVNNSGSVDLGSSGLGRDSSHPLYISGGGGGGGSTDMSGVIAAINNTQTSSEGSTDHRIGRSTDHPYFTSGITSIGDVGLGRDSSHPLFTSFIWPGKSNVPAGRIRNYDVDTFITFNSDGIVGYTTPYEALWAGFGTFQTADWQSLFNRQEFENKVIDLINSATIKFENQVIDLLNSATITAPAGGGTCTITWPQ